MGQLTSPIEQFIGFARAFQDAKISLERLSEIHGKEDEEQTLSLKVTSLPANRTLRVEEVSFSYEGADRDYEYITPNGSSSNLVLKKSLFLLNNPGSLNVYNHLIINNIDLKMLAI